MNKNSLVPLIFCILITSPLTGCDNAIISPGLDSDQESGDLLGSVKATLKDATPTVSLYDNTMQQLNMYLEQEESARTEIKLSEGELEVVKSQLLHLLPSAAREEWITNLQSPMFRLMDAHFLDMCFLFRDAAQGLKADLGVEPTGDGPAAEQYQLRTARRAFDWVCRQVYLTPPISGQDPWPAHEVLRRGHGSAEERARVFLALASQMGLFPCMIAVEEKEETENEGAQLIQKRWIPGALIGKSVYLFDTNRGLPLNGPDGDPVTLNEAVADPAIIQKSGADITFEQIKNPLVLLHCNLPGLSARMRYLETQLDADENRVDLHTNLPGLLKRFQDAGLPGSVRIWTNRSAYPAILISRYVENPANQPRLQNTIVPYVLVPRWALDFAEKNQRRMEQFFSRFDRLFLRLRIQPGGPRDALVRAQPESAIDQLLTLDTRIDKILDNGRTMPDPTRNIMQTWIPSVDVAEKELIEAIQRHQAGESSAPSDEIARLQLRLDGIWKRSEIGIFNLTYEWAAPELRRHISYFVGLAKMDQAVREELQAAAQRNPEEQEEQKAAINQNWESAVTWLSRYRAMALASPINQWANAVQFHLARCRAGQDRYQDAVKYLNEVRFGSDEELSQEEKYLRSARDELLKHYQSQIAGR